MSADETPSVRRAEADEHAATLAAAWAAVDKTACTHVPTLLRAEGYTAEADRLAECDPPAESRAGRRVLAAIDAALVASLGSGHTSERLRTALSVARAGLLAMIDAEFVGARAQRNRAEEALRCAADVARAASVVPANDNAVRLS